MTHDRAVQSWAGSLLEHQKVTKADVAALVALDYGQNVRHGRMSDDVVTHIMTTYGSVVNPTVSQWMRVFLTMTGTSLDIRPLTADFSAVHSNPLVRLRWQRFYRDLWSLPLDDRCPGLLPQNVPGVNSL